VHEVVLHGLPLGYVLRAVLSAAAVLVVSPLQDRLASFCAVEHSAEAKVRSAPRKTGKLILTYIHASRVVTGCV
jgi:hypothetical protein